VKCLTKATAEQLRVPTTALTTRPITRQVQGERHFIAVAMAGYLVEH
jgi:hypothetical protein